MTKDKNAGCAKCVNYSGIIIGDHRCVPRKKRTWHAVDGYKWDEYNCTKNDDGHCSWFELKPPRQTTPKRPWYVRMLWGW